MLIGIWSESNFLYNNFLLLTLKLFLFLLLIVKKLRIVNYFTNRRVSIWCNLNQVEITLFCHSDGFCNGIYICRYIIGNYPNVWRSYIIVNVVKIFLNDSSCTAFLVKSFSYDLSYFVK